MTRPVPNARRSPDDPPITLAELDRVDPVAADRLRAELGWPAKHSRPGDTRT